MAQKRSKLHARRAKFYDLRRADRDIIDTIVKHRLLCGEEPKWDELTKGIFPRPSRTRVYLRASRIQATVDQAEEAIDTAVAGMD